MTISNNEIKQSIDSGDYFIEARAWYNYRSVYIICQQSYLMIALVFVLMIGLYLLLNIYVLLPMHKKVPYAIRNYSATNPLLKVTHANKFANDPYKSIAFLLIKNYVKIRESFNYQELVPQLTYVQTNSSKLIYKDYYNYIDTINPNSPVLRYNREYIKKIDITDILPTQDPNQMIVRFTSKAFDQNNNLAENIIWQANVTFEMDKINDEKYGAFYFSVIEYKLKKVQILN
jgi:type IV secretion system protein VirB8